MELIHKRGGKMKQKLIFALCATILLLALAGCTGNVVKEDKTSLRLPVPIIDAHFTQYFTALENGYYADENIDVTFNPGSPEANPVKMVASGADEFGLAGGPELILIARSKGIPLVAVATFHRNSDLPVILTLKESNITKVEQLQDKKVGFFYGHISTDIIHNLLNQENIIYEEVNVGYDYSQLIAGKIDAQWAFRTFAPVNLPEKGYEVNIISPRDYGINTHGLTIFTTEEMIEENPELVRKFLRATFKGTEDMLNNPDKALENVLKNYPELDKENEMKRLEMFSKDLSNSEEFPIGYLDYEMFKETYDRLNQEGLLESEFDVNDAFTAKFVEDIHND